MPAALAFPCQQGTVGCAILDAAQRWPDRTALVFGDRQANYAEFARQTIASARSLLALGIEPGEHVGVLMPNSWDYAVLVSAINLIGACAVVLNARYRGEDLQYVIRHADISVLFTSGGARPQLDLRQLLCAQFPELAQWRASQPLAIASAPTLRAVFHFAAPDETAWPTETTFNAAGLSITDERLSARVEAVRPDDVAMVIFSSGTTAQPKACLISHRLVDEVAGTIAERLQLDASDVLWNPLPFYHLSSHLPLNACRQVGAAFVSQPQFEAGPALAEMERVGATVSYPAFPALTAAMIDHPEFKTRDLSRLRLMLNIGAPELLRKFEKALPQAVQVGCYGLTEGGGICAMSSPDDSLEQRVNRVGRPLRTHRIRIVDPTTLDDVAPGEIGEIAIAGPIFSGYFKDDAQTGAVMLADEWLRSGDLGWVDDAGYLAYSGRLKDMLKIGGENVAAVEVENFLSRHPKIKMVQVIPAPDDRLTEVVAAYIELKSGETMTEEDVVRHCIGNIASYKVPRYVRFVNQWPMSATKIQKFKLVEAFVPVEKIDIAKIAGNPAPAEPSCAGANDCSRT